MKIVTIISFLFITISGFSQMKVTGYIELRGSVDILGNIYIDQVIKPKRSENKIDSLIDYKAIATIISKFNTPIKALNALAAEGWTLVSVTQVLTDKDGKPNSPFLLYYLRHDY